MLSPEQLIRRRSWIGASESAKLLGCSPWGNATELFYEKRPDLLPGRPGARPEPTEAMELGNIVEPLIIAHAAKQLGVRVEEQREIVSASHPFIGCTLDALILDRPEAIEAKLAMTSEGWGEEDTDQVPDQYQIQCQHQILVGGLERVWLFALRPAFGRIGIRRYRIEPNAALCGAITDACTDFWTNHVVPGVPPTDAPPPMRILASLERAEGKSIPFDEKFGKIADEWERAKGEAKAWEERADEVKKALIFGLGDAELGVLPDGRRFSFKEQERRSLDTKALGAAHPDIAEKFTKVSAYRVARLSKGK